jgi:purine nucleosidase
MSWGVHGLEPNATVIESVDSQGFYAYITGLLAMATTPSRPFRS